MEKDLQVPLDPRHKYKGESLNLPIIDYVCTCKGEDELALRRILPTGLNTAEVCVYNSCKRTLVAALKRQIRKTPEPEKHVVKELQAFMEDYFEKYLRKPLQEFDYSYSKWYNHLQSHKQSDIDKVDKTNNHTLSLNKYGLFCKREKQEMGGKNRAIANISPETKYVMGPVCWELEELFSKYAPGYCGSMNWEQLESFYEEKYAQGFTYVVQGDGSAFDLSQHYDCKYIDRMIYNFLVDNQKIHHVDKEVFRKVATDRHRKMKATYFYKGRAYTLGEAEVDGTVFSGSSDTTLMNTLRMAIYNMFTLHKAGLTYEKDYYLKSKGDDFFILLKQMRDYNSIYYKYWISAIKDPLSYDYKPFGIGQILKFLVIGDYSTLDFCSTTVCPYGNGKFKIYRKPDRMSTLYHYSRAALRLTTYEYSRYLISQAESLEASVGQDTPFYSDYAKAFRFHAAKLWDDSLKKPKIKKYPARKTLIHDNHKSLRDDKNDSTFSANLIMYGWEIANAMQERVSTRKPPDIDVYHHLLHRYHLTKLDITAHAQFLKYGGLYDHIAGMIRVPSN